MRVRVLTTAVAAGLLAGCGSGVPYPPAHESRAEHAARIACEVFTDRSGRYEHGSDAWRRHVLSCARGLGGS